MLNKLSEIREPKQRATGKQNYCQKIKWICEETTMFFGCQNILPQFFLGPLLFADKSLQENDWSEIWNFQLHVGFWYDLSLLQYEKNPKVGRDAQNFYVAFVARAPKKSSIMWEIVSFALPCWKYNRFSNLFDFWLLFSAGVSKGMLVHFLTLLVGDYLDRDRREQSWQSGT